MSEARSLAIQLLMVAVGFGLTLAMAGCGGRVQPEQKIVTVQVPVIKPCIEKAPARPVYQTGKGEYPGEKAAAKILADDFEKAEQYGADWEAAAAGCLVVPADKP
jgi:hypothetical protein